MPRRYDLETLRTRCRQRADIENNEHITDAELASLMSETYGELYEIVSGTGLRYFETTHDFTADGSDSYDEPDDHGKSVGVDRVNADGSRVTLLPLMPGERSRYAGQVGDACEYAIVDDQIVLYPNPASGDYEVIYIPQPPDLSGYADSDLIDVVCIYGEAFLIWGTAVKALSKSESDVRLAMAERDRNAQKLLEWAAERDANEPRRRVIDGDDGSGGISGGGGWWSR
jgi:hypothetical protein